MGLTVDFERAEEHRKCIQEKLCYLKDSGKCVYIFGGGFFGKNLKDHLSKEGISSTIVVDDEYVSGSGGEAISLTEALENKNSIFLYGIFNDGFSESFYCNIKRLSDRIGGELIIPHGYWGENYGLMVMETIVPDFIKENMELFNSTYELLFDQLSRDIMEAYLYAGISFNADVLEKYWTDKEHDYELELLFSKMPKGIVLECGAFDGKSIVEMSEYLGNGIKMIAMECDDFNYFKLCEKTRSYPNIRAIALGAWDKEAKLAIMQNGSKSMLVHRKINI